MDKWKPITKELKELNKRADILRKRQELMLELLKKPRSVRA